MEQPIQITSLEPSALFVRDGEALRQLIRLQVENSGAEHTAVLHVRAGGIDERLPLGTIPAGAAERKIYLPDLRDPAVVDLKLQVGDTFQQEMRLDWQPQKHWEVHLVHYSHHDLGYTDLPLNVLKEHAGFLDDVLRYCDATRDWPEEAA